MRTESLKPTQTYIYLVPATTTIITKPALLTGDNRIVKETQVIEMFRYQAKNGKLNIASVLLHKDNYPIPTTPNDQLSIMTPYGFVPFSYKLHTKANPQQELTLKDPQTNKTIKALILETQKVWSFDEQQPITQKALLQINPATESTSAIPYLTNQEYNCRGLQIKNTLIYPESLTKTNTETTFEIKTTAKHIYIDRIQISPDKIL